jgi:DNA modification methylase
MVVAKSKNLELLSDYKSHNQYYKKFNTASEWMEEWTFKKFKTNTFTHKIHKYPAMFIPQLTRKIIEKYSNKNDSVLDIFNGSGSTMVECMLLERNAIGIEINPLANLITKVKITHIDIEEVKQNLKIINEKFEDKNFKFKTIEFNNIDFWFKTNVKKMFSKILYQISFIRDRAIKDFFKVCLSEIVREFSLCNHSGFKMHRDKKKIDKSVNKCRFIKRFNSVCNKNIYSLYEFINNMSNHNTSKIIKGCSKKFYSEIGKEKVDLILTSPSYGDSHTTVAYGQFSRLSSQMLNLSLEGLDDIAKLDNNLLGGKTNKKNQYNKVVSKSLTLSNTIELFKTKILALNNQKKEKIKMEKRLLDVLSFYYDLDICLKNGVDYLKSGKYFILVTGSRVVKMVKLHTDIILSELAENYNMKLVSIFYRNIENKRMPNKVSATNIVGEKAPTMTKESIVVLKKLNT